MSKIVVGSKEFVPYVTPASQLDTAVYRYLPPGIAPAFASKITIAATPNKVGSNINMTVAVAVPIVVIDPVNGQSAKDTIKVSLTYTSLQQVVATVEKTLAIDAMISALTAHRTLIIDGSTVA